MGVSSGLAVRLFGPPKRSARVVLALPGDRPPFENGAVADVARRTALVAGYVAPEGTVEPWVYARDKPYRLPDIRRGERAHWVADWGSLRPKPLLTADAAPSTPLEAFAAEHDLFRGTTYGDISAGMRAIAEEAAGYDVPTFVIFFLWLPDVDRKSMARELDAASGRQIFWEFLEELDEDHTRSAAHPVLKQLRKEAPHITNAHAYCAPYYTHGQPNLNFWLYSALLNPFSRWYFERPRPRPA